MVSFALHVHHLKGKRILTNQTDYTLTFLLKVSSIGFAKELPTCAPSYQRQVVAVS